MCEIIALVVLSKLIYEQAEEKELPGIPLVLAFLAMWIGCEFVGILLAILFGPPGIGMLCGMYALAFMGAAVGGGSVFAFVAFYPRRKAPRLDADVPDPEEFFRKKRRKKHRRRRVEDDDDYDDRPRRRSREDDDDETPKPRRARRDDDDNDEPDTRIRPRRHDD